MANVTVLVGNVSEDVLVTLFVFKENEKVQPLVGHPDYLGVVIEVEKQG